MNYTKGGFPIWDDDFEREHFTEEEIAESKLNAAIIAALMKAREDQGLTQRQLSEITGIKQPVIARIESGKSLPNISTLMKLLIAMGKTLQVVPIKAKKA